MGESVGEALLGMAVCLGVGTTLGASLGMEVDTLMGVRDGPLVVVFVGDAVGAIVTNGEG